jgi:DNA invertase Pin-like site-specific DNA recombinase
MQLEDLRRFAGQRFGERREYVDTGVSGAQRRRPQLDALMVDARRRRFDAVLVWKFDRFARSVKHLVDSL